MVWRRGERGQMPKNKIYLFKRDKNVALKEVKARLYRVANIYDALSL